MRKKTCAFVVYITSFLLTIYMLSSSAQAQNIALSDSLRRNINRELSQIQNIDFNSATKDNILSLKSLGTCFQQLNNFDSAALYYRQGLELTIKNNEKELSSSIAYNLSLLHMNQGLYATALEYGLQALETDRELAIQENVATSLNGVALIYQEWGAYEKALKYRLEALTISELTLNKLEIANSYYNLGNVYRKIGKADKAIICFNKAKKRYKELLETSENKSSVYKGLSECIYSIGGLEINKNNFTAALKLFRNALEIKTTINDNIGIGNCYSQIAAIHFEQNNFQLAKQTFFKSLSYKLMTNDSKGIALVYYSLGNLNYQTGSHTDAESFLKKSISTAQQIGDKEILRENYRILFEIYKQKKKPQLALKYHEVYTSYTDSVLNENTTKLVEELNVKYETDKKEQENQFLSQENKISALTIQKQKAMGMYLIGVIVLVLIIVVVLFVLFRSKQKTNTIISHKNKLLGEQNSQIVTQKKLIENKNRDLTDSIMYAKRIQESMLSDMNILNDDLEDSFILFKPKDIVSGDFYWFGKQNNKLIISAIDCTGHGVPGAFMSMLGNSFLNEIVFKLGVTSPDKILEALSKEVQLALKQHESHNKDGMDMALCSIDLATGIIEFAGAKNPLVYITKNGLERIKGDKKPIGISYNQEADFHKHQVTIEESTSFYMFSDGYVDQFGGPDNKKFLSKRLHKLLLEINNKPMAEQKKILDNAIEVWMKNHEQIDDILIVGFKIKK